MKWSQFVKTNFEKGYKGEIGKECHYDDDYLWKYFLRRTHADMERWENCWIYQQKSALCEQTNYSNELNLKAIK